MSNTTRIAKNTLMLYFRQTAMILVSLYTVRVKLDILGVENFGIYNIVAGVVVMFAFMNTAMTNSIQRFLNFAMGKNDTEQVRNIYSISLVIHFLLALIFIFLTETVGLWIFYTWLEIPLDRIFAGQIVFQLSIATTAVNILRVPYRATIIAYEKISFFTLITFIEILFKLGIIFLLPVIPFDKLLIYAFFVLLTDITIFLLHKIFCNRKIEIANFYLCRNKELFRQVAKFSWWNIFGKLAETYSWQGVNILINVFRGVTLNAALGIATQVNSTLFTFVSNFQTAFNPQLIKSYATQDNNYFERLIFVTSKMSFFLLFLFVLPLYINADFVLNIWLKEVPDYTVTFTRLILLNSLLSAMAGPLITVIQATGNIKKYQLITSCLLFASLPLSFLFLRMGFNPTWVLKTGIGASILLMSWRLLFLNRNIHFPVMNFLRKVIIPTIIVSTVSGFITLFSFKFFNNWFRLIFSCSVSTITIGACVYLIGLNAQEKTSVYNFINRKLLRHAV